MELVILSIHLLVCACLIGLVLLQRSEGGALGMGGGGGSLISGRGAADALARMTSVAGGFFLVTSLGLTMLSGADASNRTRSVFDRAPATAPAVETPATAPVQPTPDPTESSVPAETQVASLSPAQASAATPPASPAAAGPSTAARAAPLETTQQPRTQPASVRTTPPASTPRTTPTQTATTQPTATQRTTPASATQRPVAAAPATTQRTAPATNNGAVSGITLTDTAPESLENTQTPRRERAGPDQ